ncbi:alpha/beta fold hydrolase [Actinoplanes sp. NPDC049118]|uniref:thioesterase II family protein n=1 Tax=Actinoplanes sp. NPDC049118 TaxID=3155769 RepID=UPI0033C6E768
MSATAVGSEWISCAFRRPAATVRLFCFPYAGGGATAFQPWVPRLPATVEVWPVCLPGREQRLFDPAYTSLPDLVAELREALAGPMADSPVPVAFFGHSLGALLAFELARSLREHGDAEPSTLVLSGRAAPHRAPGRRLATLPDDAFVAAVQRFGATPSAALDHPEVRELCLPMLRADFTMAETYTYRPGPPLDCPVTTWAGKDDPGATPDLVEQWAGYTTGPVRHRTFPGGHFFLHTDGSVFDALAEDLSRSR